ncbi:hypothetical protein SAMN05421820_103608 [Pedobacter steynii]|uniref:Uncharacterized protein n=1 Tax=Pedobacter steynii TaxID=430522 RepID=A0A1G9SHQ6_9SPHI|nr:hypothetical protein [Pedobacter steynii]NQX37411.1 hypothetical protein [Pedobacter steynii]SDM35038.1 hypothetical protein SAMN05421820_103608 [Pedobacter steynii]
MYEIEETGGANIGFGRATWPFAKLLVNKNELQLNASILGNVYFRPSDVISIEPFTLFSGTGIKINHRVGGYSEKVIFLTSGSRDLIKRINDTGFLSNSDTLPAEVEARIIKYQSSGSFPLKWSAVVIFGLIWNLLFLGDLLGYFGNTNNRIPIGIGAQMALAFAFLFALAILLSEPFSRLVLKDGRKAKELKSFLFFLMLISGLMFTIFSLFTR